MFLVLLETSGNQNFIFATNKLKENIGASELTYCAGTKWVLEEVGKINGSKSLEVWRDSDRLRQLLTSEQHNPPLETSNLPVEIIIATSGKALLLTKDKETAQKIITAVTTKAQKEAPGMDLCGVFEEFNWDDGNTGSLAEATKKVYQKFDQVHSKYPSPHLRFLRLPIIDECSTSEYPASCIVQGPNNSDILLSAVSYHKQQCTESALERINYILSKKKNPIEFTKNVNQLEKEFDNLEWLAVIHADGNGLGKIFLNFQNSLDHPQNNREYINKLREFSIAIDICTEKAFLEAINVFEIKTKNKTKQIFPLVPLILGGDDLTIICDGKCALNFIHKFLTSFELETSTQTIIPKIAKQTNLSACAGIAIIKPHFPFSVAYELAEKLINQAKIVKQKAVDKESNIYPCSAIDFHILYDSSGVELEQIRQRLTVDQGQTKLYSKPFIITEVEKLANLEHSNWLRLHHWDKFAAQVKLLKQKDDQGKRQIPTSQINNLRVTAFLGKTATDSTYQLISHRYNLKIFEGEDKSLFTLEDEEKHLYFTSFIDALETVDFFNFSENNHEN